MSDFAKVVLLATEDGGRVEVDRDAALISGYVKGALGCHMIHQ